MHFRTVTECSCLKCKSMCQNSPCMGTPEDIQKIMDAGYGDKLMFSLWTDHKSANAPLPAIMPIKGPRGCVFQDKKGLCDLHAAGLKPTEGKLAIHDQNDNGLAGLWAIHGYPKLAFRYSKDLAFRTLTS